MSVSFKASALRLANRLDEVGFSDIVVIRNKVMALLAEGRSVYQFQGGEPFFPTPPEIKDAMTRALQEEKTRYAPSSGLLELRRLFAAKLRSRNAIHADPDDVIVTNGGMHALSAAFNTVLNPGDETLIFSPYWTPIRDMVAGCQSRPVLVDTRAARERGISGMLAGHITEQTRAIYYNTPQNPSGLVFDRREAEEVAAFAQEYDLIVIADEAYEDLVYEGQHVSIASLPGMFERTITCFTLSKSYSMTGWRVGYAVAREPWMTGLRKMVLYTTNGVSTPSQWAAVTAMNTPVESLMGRREQFRQRRDLLVNGLNEIGLNCAMPAGAFYAFPDVASIHRDSRVAASRLLEAAQVATVPGIVFGPEGESHLRFSFSTAMETIQAGLDSLRRNL